MYSPRIQRALISVSDKLGLADFARGLSAAGVEIYSTGGTRKHLESEGIPVRDVSEYTGFPEMMDGRLKTLHPKVHGGILCRHDNPEDMKALAEHGILTFELVVVNLYPFESTVARKGVSLEEAIEQIDIGGPTLVRAASKNHAFTTIATNAAQYSQILEEVTAHGGTTLDAAAAPAPVPEVARRHADLGGPRDGGLRLLPHGPTTPGRPGVRRHRHPVVEVLPLLQPPAFVNQYAAMPSLHVGWDLLAGVAIFTSTTIVAVRVLACLMPVLMVWAVIATGNHYLLDVVAGIHPRARGLRTEPAARASAQPPPDGPLVSPLAIAHRAGKLLEGLHRANALGVGHHRVRHPPPPRSARGPAPEDGRTAAVPVGPGWSSPPP